MLSMLAPRSVQAEEGRALGLGEVLERMATTRGVEARFRERKELALLAVPLETRGLLYFVPPDRLAWFTIEPSASALIIDGEELRYRDAGDDTDVDLSRSPVAHAFVDNLVVLFNGDRERLERIHRVGISGDRRAWQLELTPRGAPLSRFVERITLRGEEAGLKEMVVRSADGDRTVTLFEDVQTDREFGAAELERLFSVGAPLGVPSADR
jgi:outer membrane lipoprotein-sorting protein